MLTESVPDNSLASLLADTSSRLGTQLSLPSSEPPLAFLLGWPMCPGLSRAFSVFALKGPHAHF